MWGHERKTAKKCHVDGGGLGRRTKSEFFSKCPDCHDQSCAYPRRMRSPPISVSLRGEAVRQWLVHEMRLGWLHRNAEQSVGSMGVNMKSKMDTPVLVLHKHTGLPLCGTVLYCTYCMGIMAFSLSAQHRLKDTTRTD